MSWCVTTRLSLHCDARRVVQHGTSLLTSTQSSRSNYTRAPLQKTSVTAWTKLTAPLSVSSSLNLVTSSSGTLRVTPYFVSSRADISRPCLCTRSLVTTSEPKDKKKSKLKKMLKEYGPVFFCFHLFTSCVTYTIFYTLVSRGFDTSSLLGLADTYTDVDAILSKAGYSRSLLLEPPSPSSSAVIALLLYKLSGPIRLFLDSLAVPMLVRLFRQIGLMEPVNPVNEQQAEMVLSRIEALDKKLETIDLAPVQRAIRKQVQGRRDRRTRQLAQYADTQRKIDKVFRKKSTKGNSRGR